MDVRSVFRGWMTITVVQLLGTAFQCLDSKLIAERMFSASGKGQVSPLFCRLLATWYVTMAVLRLFSIFEFDCRVVHVINVCLLIVSICYFSVEAFIFRTVDIGNIAVATNLIMSVVTLVLMIICWKYLWISNELTERGKITRNKGIKVGNEFSSFGPFEGVTRTTLSVKKGQ